MSAGERWFVRVRGLVNGPYDLQRLRGMVARGRLSRVHEVSSDGRSWAPASSVFGLFDGSGTAAAGGDFGGGPGSGFGGDPGSYDAPAAAADEWYYASQGAQSGPVSSDELRRMVLSGSLSADALVWRSGLSSWAPARDVPELGVAPQAQSMANPRPERSWSRTLAVTAVVLLVLAALGFGTFALVGTLTADPLVVSNIESPAAAAQISQAVGLVVNGWHTVSEDGKQQDRDFLLGSPFDGPYEKVTSGSTVAFSPLRPDEGIEIYKTKTLYKKVGDAYRQLPENGLCVTPASGPSRMVHQLSGTGTCFAVTANGYAITNRHVVKDAWEYQHARQLLQDITQAGSFDRVDPTVWVFFGEKQYNAEIVHVSEKYDLAILKIENRKDSPHFALAQEVNEASLPRGHKVYVLGFPGAARTALSEEELQMRHAHEEIGTRVSSKFAPADFEYSQHDGSISKIVRRESVGSVIQHNADINPGNSGGPLVTRDGRVFGINTWTVEGASGIHFSVAIDQLREEIGQHVDPPPIWK